MAEEAEQHAERGQYTGRIAVLVVTAIVVAAAVLHQRGESPITERAPAAPEPSATAPPIAPTAPRVVPGQPLPGSDSSVSAVPQPLLLIATAPGRNPREGTARLGTEAHNPQTYSAGAILANRARLSEIHADHVVLERDGRRRLLYIEDKGPQLRDEADLAMVGGAAPAPRTIQFAEDRLVDVIRHMPYYDGELFAGLQIFPGRHAGPFAQLGLKSGDVIVSIDAVPLADQAAAAELLHTLTEGAVLTVTVLRAGVRMDVSLDGTIMLPAAQAEAASPMSLPDPAGG